MNGAGTPAEDRAGSGGTGGLERRARAGAARSRGRGSGAWQLTRAGQAPQGLCSPEASPGLLQAGPLCDLLPKVWGPENRCAGLGAGGRPLPRSR